MNEPPLATLAEPLHYAGLLVRYGIMHDRGGNGDTVITVPLSFWRQLVGTLIFAKSLGGLQPGFKAAGSHTAATCAATYKRLGRPMVFRLTPSALRVENVQEGGEITDRVFARSAVYDIKYVSHSNYVVIRARGHEMLEVRPVGDRRVLRWLADTLRAAMWPDQPPKERT